MVMPNHLLEREDVIVIVDEAQQSYADYSFWISCIKHQATTKTGARFALFSSYGSATNTALSIPGSAPVTLEHTQRVSLTVQPQHEHAISLCFSPEEVIEICDRLTCDLAGNSTFSISREVIEHIYLLANGHPGLTDGILRSVVDLEVNISLL